MLGDAFSNMLVILLPILEYLSRLLSDLQTVFTITLEINKLSFDLCIKSVHYIFLNAIAALKIAGQNGNLSS